jgi:hypothetical protein
VGREVVTSGSVDRAPEDRTAVHGTSSWKLWLHFLFVLGWVLLAFTMAFVRGPSKPSKPSGEPATWKVWLYLVITLVAFGGFVALTGYGHSFTMPPGLAH